MIVAAVSKYICSAALSTGSQSGNRTTIELNRYAVPVPTATRVFISAEKCRASFHATAKNLFPGTNITTDVAMKRSLFTSSIEKGEKVINQSVMFTMLMIMTGTVRIALKMNSFFSCLYDFS